MANDLLQGASERAQKRSGLVNTGTWGRMEYLYLVLFFSSIFMFICILIISFNGLVNGSKYFSELGELCDAGGRFQS